MNSVKDILINKITDDILNLLIGKSTDEIKNLINQNKRQRILLHCFEKFIESDLYLKEFKKSSCIIDKDLLLSISDDILKPELTVDELVHNLSGYFKKCIITDENESFEQITKYLCVSYKSQIKTTLELYNLLELEQINTDKIINELETVKDLVIKGLDEQRNKEYKKEQLIKEYLQNEFTNYYLLVIDRFVYLVTKGTKKCILNGDTTTKGLIKGETDALRDTVKDINNYIKNDFVRKPIQAISSPSMETHEISYFEFMEMYFKKPIIEATQKLLEYDRIISNELYLILLEILNSLNGNIFPSLYQSGMISMVENLNRIEINVSDFINAYSKLGKTILKLQPYI